MPNYSFTKSGNSELYVYDDTGTPVTGKTYTVGFLKDPSATSLPATLSLEDSWADAHGLYLFYQETPPNEAKFTSDIRNYLKKGGFEGTRFIWISNSNEIPAFWDIHQISTLGTTPAQLSHYTEIQLQNYILCMDQGLNVTLSSPANGAQSAAFVITQVATGQIRLKTGSGDAPLSDIGMSMNIPMQDSLIGCLQYTLTIAQSPNVETGTQMGSLDAGVSFFYPDPEWDKSFLSKLTYPVIDPSTAPVDFYPVFDPLNPLLPARTLFGFLPPDGTAPQLLSSYYRTWVGRNVPFNPKSGTAPGFAMSAKPQFPNDGSPPFMLVPNGGFTLDIPPIAGAVPTQGESDSSTRLMCGLSPVEYVGYLPPNTGAVANTATFYPGKAAYAPSFDPRSDTGASAELTEVALTSYVAFTPNGPAAMNYYSQPSQSVYYDPSVHAPSNDANFLDMKEIITSELASGDNAAMPMVAFAGIDNALNQVAHSRFEIKVISQARRNKVQADYNQQPHVMANMAANANNATPVAARATTRHGMLGFFGTPTAQDVPFVKVQLAQSNHATQTLTLAGSSGNDIAGSLKSALQSSELFLVISNAVQFRQKGSFLSSLLEIADIPFDLDPDKWAENGTIFIYKYSGDSIKNLAGDLSSWSYPTDFTDGGLTQNNLLTIIKGVEDKINVDPGQKPDPNFLHIYEAITDPNWNGILAFNTEVSLADMPGQLAGIAAGIDPAQFRAHHLGINISPMTVEQSVLTMQDTALFGLINYIDDTPFVDSGAADNFKVSMLKILFGNSEIRDFACKINLQVGSLFGSQVILKEPSLQQVPPAENTANNSGNVIVLDGYYQSTKSGDTFSFTSNRDIHFKASSEVLDEVEIVGANFITLNPNTPADASGVKSYRTQFTFSGRIKYHDVAGFDGLSFGDVVGDVPMIGGLSYSNLVIHMDYDITDEGVTQNKVFEFDAQNISIDMANSVARPESLFSHFPLKFKKLMQGRSDTMPTGYGYLAAATPITESTLTYPWYGLQYELNLGTFGSLASSAGFTASVLIGWSPGAGNSLFTGVKIPGASPENLSFSIEGLLGLSIDDIKFTADQSPEGSTAYTLVFSNLALRFFGLKIPQSAYVDLVLFGNPDPSKQATSLGWYASYNAAS